jgi:hypothetical protein
MGRTQMAPQQGVRARAPSEKIIKKIHPCSHLETSRVLIS